MNLISKLTFDGAPLTENDILVFTEDIGGNTITILYNNVMLDWALEEGSRYHSLSLTESVSYLDINIPAFTLYLIDGVWMTEKPETVELEDVEIAAGYNTSSLIHIRDWNLDGDETTAVNKMCRIKPVINQVECNIYFQQEKLREVCKQYDIILLA